MIFKHILLAGVFGFIAFTVGAIAFGYYLHTPEPAQPTYEVRVERVEVPVGPDKLLDELNMCRLALAETQEALNMDRNCSSRMCELRGPN